MKFSCGGIPGLDVFAAGYPAVAQIACGSTALPTGTRRDDDCRATARSAYDPATDTYTYVWKTHKAWAGTCRQLVVKLEDGTFHQANFQFT